jgi:hypothetical protein
VGRSRSRLALPTVLAAAVLLAFPAGASAITKAQADRAAQRALDVADREPPVVLFGLGKRLAAEAHVSEAFPEKRVTRVPAIGRRAWLYWLDLAHGARFQHDSRLLLVDDRTGRPFRNVKLAWWPTIEGRDAPFAGKGYGRAKRKYEVESIGVRASGRLAGPFSESVEDRFGAGTANHAAPNLPANAFANDCVVMVGQFFDTKFDKDFAAMEDAGKKYHFRVFRAKVPKGKSGPTGATLNKAVDKAVAAPNNCKDVLIYASSHGVKVKGPVGADPVLATGLNTKTTVKPGPNGTLLVTAEPVETVTGGDVATILAEHPTVTFKMKIDACFSGMWIDFLKEKKLANLLLVETASARNEVAFSGLAGIGKKKKKGTFVKNTKNPDLLGEFTNGNLAGIDAFTKSKDEIDIASAKGGSLFAQMLARAFTLGAGSDFARLNGRTHPQILSNLPTQIPQCSDRIDNDDDGFADFDGRGAPPDPGCAGPRDNSEFPDPKPECSDDVDNDSDGKVDFDGPGNADPGCVSLTDEAESPDPQQQPPPPACTQTNSHDANTTDTSFNTDCGTNPINSVGVDAASDIQFHADPNGWMCTNTSGNLNCQPNGSQTKMDGLRFTVNPAACGPFSVLIVLTDGRQVPFSNLNPCP